MCNVFLGPRVLAVEVATIGQQFGGGHLPGAIIFSTLVPPRNQRREFLELNRRGFGVVFPAFGQRLFVIPDVIRRFGAIEEQNIRLDACVGREDAGRKTYNSVKIELFEQFFLDPLGHATCK